MSDVRERLGEVIRFRDLGPEELDLLAGLAEEVEFDAGETVFAEGDPGAGLYILIEGAVEGRKRVSEDLDRTIATIRDSGTFGEIALIDGLAQPNSIVAVEATKVLYLAPEKVAELHRANPKTGIKLFSILSRALCTRLRVLSEEYTRTVEWGLSVSGAMGLNLHRLIADRVPLSVELTSGARAEGVLLKVDKSEAGHELILEGEGDRVSVVPYHAIAHMSFDRNLLELDAD